MREQAVKRVFNNLASQDRVVLELRCGHYVSLSSLEVFPRFYHHLMKGDVLWAFPTWPCAQCPDPDPKEVREEKPATQLWREAGEP